MRQVEPQSISCLRHEQWLAFVGVREVQLDWVTTDMIRQYESQSRMAQDELAACF